MVDMLCQINLMYKKKIVYTRDRRRKSLYGKLAKAVYGMLLGSILLYNKLSQQLEDWGFEQNDYDECTWNKTVDGKQLTVQAHIDDLICVCKDQCVLDNFIRELNGVFGIEKKLEETKGDVHEYLGLTIIGTCSFVSHVVSVIDLSVIHSSIPANSLSPSTVVTLNPRDLYWSMIRCIASETCLLSYDAIGTQWIKPMCFDIAVK